MTPAYTATSFGYSAGIAVHKLLMPLQQALLGGIGQHQRQVRTRLRRGLDE